jgi:hypothetical protein
VGISRIIAEFDVRRSVAIIREKSVQLCGDARDWWRGWTETDIDSLRRKLDEPSYYSGGIVKITLAEHRAWSEFNRRLLAQNPRMVRSPLMAWAEGKGLFPMIRLLPNTK